MRPLNPEPVAELERLHAETVALVRWMEKNDGLSYGAVILAMVDEAKAHREGHIASEAQYHALRHYCSRLEADPAAQESERRVVLVMLDNYGGDSAPAAT